MTERGQANFVHQFQQKSYMVNLFSTGDGLGEIGPNRFTEVAVKQVYLLVDGTSQTGTRGPTQVGIILASRQQCQLRFMWD